MMRRRGTRHSGGPLTPWLILLLAALLLPSTSWAALAYESGSSGQAQSGLGSTGVTVTQCASCLMVACVSSGQSAATIGDTKGNTWNVLVSGHNDGFSGRITGWYAYNVGSGSNTITTTVSGGSRIAVASFSGAVTGSDPLDVAAGPTDNSFTTTWASAATGVRAQANEVLVTCLEDTIDHGATNYFSDGAAAPTYIEAFEGGTFYLQMQYAIVSATTSYTGNATAADGTNGGTIFVAAFKEASAATDETFGYLRRRPR